MPKRKDRQMIQTQEPATAELRALRAKLIGQVKRLEWDFDKDATPEVVRKLQRARREIGELEVKISIGHRDAVINQMLEEINSIAVVED